MTAEHESRMSSLRAQADYIERELESKKQRVASRDDEETKILEMAREARRKSLAEIERLKSELDKEDEDARTPEKFDLDEAELRLEEIRQRMRHAEERHKAWLEHVEKHANAPMSFVRGSNGRIIGAK